MFPDGPRMEVWCISYDRTHIDGALQETKGKPHEHFGSRLDQTRTERVHCSLGTSRAIKLREGVANVVLNRLLGETQV